MRPPLAVALCLLGCGGLSADSPLMMTCDIRNNPSAAAHGQCQEWRGDVNDSTNKMVDFNSICTGVLSGVVLNATCPRGTHVGICTKRPSVAKRVVLLFYYSPDYDTSTATTACAGEGGTFAPP